MLDGSTGRRIRCLISLKLIPHLRNIHYLFSPTLPAWAGGLFHWRRLYTSPPSQCFALCAIHYPKQRRQAISEGISKKGKEQKEVLSHYKSLEAADRTGFRKSWWKDNQGMKLGNASFKTGMMGKEVYSLLLKVG